MDLRKKSPFDVYIEPWHNLWDITVKVSEPLIQDHTNEAISVVTPTPSDNSVLLQDLGRETAALYVDLKAYPYDENAVRQKRLDLSSRKFEDERRQLEERKLAWTCPIGRWRFLVEHELNAHTFALNLAFNRLRRDPEISRLQKEAKVGDSGAAGDIIVHLKNGFRECWEITLSVGNVPSNAAKLENYGFSKIVFLCRDFKVQQVAWASLRESGLSRGLLERVRCMLFSTLLKKYRAINLGE